MNPEPASLPRGPGFAALVGIHLRSLWREFPVAWLAFGGLAVVLPVVSAFYRGSLDPADPMSGVVTFTALLTLLFFLTIALAFLWPEAVWRNLPPGGRLVMDALPVDRRTHRIARITAGLVLPLGMAGSVGITAAILRSNPDLSFLSTGLGADGSGATGVVVALLSLTAAYLLSSALALRFGRVFMGLFVLAGGGTLVIFVLVILGLEEAAVATQQGLFLGDWAPGRVLTLANSAQGEDLPAALLWFSLLLGLCTFWAGRYDRA